MNPQPSVLETGALPVELLPSADRHDANGQADHRGGALGYHQGHRISQATPERPVPAGQGAQGDDVGFRPIGRCPVGPNRPLSRWSGLPGLLVHGVLAVPTTELLHLDPFPVVQLVLRGDVIPSFALLTGQGDLDALLVLCHGDSLVRPAISFFLVVQLVAAAGLEPATPRL